MAVATPVVHTTLLAAALAMQILIAEFTTKQNDIMIDVAAQQFLHRQGRACVVFSCGVQQCVARIATSSVPSSFISVTRAQVRLLRHVRVSILKRVSPTGAAANVHTLRRLQPAPFCQQPRQSLHAVSTCQAGAAVRTSQQPQSTLPFCIQTAVVVLPPVQLAPHPVGWYCPRRLRFDSEAAANDACLGRANARHVAGTVLWPGVVAAGVVAAVEWCSHALDVRCCSFPLVCNRKIWVEQYHAMYTFLRAAVVT